MKRKDRQKKIDYEKAVIFTQKAIPLAGLTGTCWNGKVFQGFDFKSFNFMTKGFWRVSRATVTESCEL